ncbi:hypothetical protein BCR36DRAFT_408279 [Piromyces finnis]|uniref:C2H2-type domain-containing protein n=1 Tax=Piromyces finnis TaxID=1754191 RepID=A0A1Y1VLW6_9FUNG|nr:hypothetical protein BCR36DRAFT_408279 [Piromyces finnis]|eukprot:ORX59908.1 hypothetical protein BCR36DRAFT_408279 [Piromyces finnis]
MYSKILPSEIFNPPPNPPPNLLPPNPLLPNHQQPPNPQPKFLQNTKKTNPQENNNYERLFHCSTCLKTFKRCEHLIRHLRIHSGEKPYKCSYFNCNKRFSRRDGLKRHEQLHYQKQKQPNKIGILKKKKIHDTKFLNKSYNNNNNTNRLIPLPFENRHYTLPASNNPIIKHKQDYSYFPYSYDSPGSKKMDYSPLSRYNNNNEDQRYPQDSDNKDYLIPKKSIQYIPDNVYNNKNYLEYESSGCKDSHSSFSLSKRYPPIQETYSNSSSVTCFPPHDKDPYYNGGEDKGNYPENYLNENLLPSSSSHKDPYYSKNSPYPLEPNSTNAYPMDPLQLIHHYKDNSPSPKEEEGYLISQKNYKNYTHRTPNAPPPLEEEEINHSSWNSNDKRYLSPRKHCYSNTTYGCYTNPSNTFTTNQKNNNLSPKSKEISNDLLSSYKQDTHKDNKNYCPILFNHYTNESLSNKEDYSTRYTSTSTPTTFATDRIELFVSPKDSFSNKNSNSESSSRTLVNVMDKKDDQEKDIHDVKKLYSSTIFPPPKFNDQDSEKTEMNISRKDDTSSSNCNSNDPYNANALFYDDDDDDTTTEKEPHQYIKNENNSTHYNSPIKFGMKEGERINKIERKITSLDNPCELSNLDDSLQGNSIKKEPLPPPSLYHMNAINDDDNDNDNNNNNIKNIMSISFITNFCSS